MYSAYGCAGFQVLGVDGVLVEAVPLLKGVLGLLMLLLGVPVQHAHVELDADRGAVVPEHALGVVKQVVGVHDADLDAVGLGHGAVVFLAADLGADNAGVLAVVEETAELVVAGLLGHELVEAGLLDKRRHTAAVVAGDGVARVADEESEVELLQQLLGHDRRVAGLRRSAVGVRGTLGVLHDNAGVLVSDTLGLAIGAVGADTALGDVQRRRDAGWLLVWRDEVVSDVFDENALALFC